MKVINLLPQSEQHELKMEQQALVLGTFMLWSLTAIIMFFLITLTAEILIRQNTAAVEHQITRYEDELKSATNQKLDEEVKTLNNQIKQIDNLRKQHYYWSNVLAEIANITPSDLSVNFLNLDRSTGKIEISGVAGNRASVLEFWANVKRSNMFKDINFPLSNLEKSSNGGFTYTFYVKPEEAKKE